MSSKENDGGHYPSDQAPAPEDPEFFIAYGSPFGCPDFDLSFGAPDFDDFPSFNGLVEAKRYLFEVFKDELGHEFIVRTDLDTGVQERFVRPPPSARD